MTCTAGHMKAKFMDLTTTILLVLALYLAQLFLQETSRFGFDWRAITGNRDRPPEMSVVAARLDRAKNNMLEALPFFLGLSLMAMVKGDEARVLHPAWVFLIARILYVPAYVSGLRFLRSLLWLGSVGSLALMAIALK